MVYTLGPLAARGQKSVEKCKEVSASRGLPKQLWYHVDETSKITKVMKC